MSNLKKRNTFVRYINAKLIIETSHLKKELNGHSTLLSLYSPISRNIRLSNNLHTPIPAINHQLSKEGTSKSTPPRNKKKKGKRKSIDRKGKGVEIDRNDGLSGQLHRTNSLIFHEFIDSASAIFRQDQRNGETEDDRYIFRGDIPSFSLSLLCSREGGPASGIHVAMFCRRVVAAKKGVVKLEAGQPIAESASSL